MRTFASLTRPQKTGRWVSAATGVAALAATITAPAVVVAGIVLAVPGSATSAQAATAIRPHSCLPQTSHATHTSQRVVTLPGGNGSKYKSQRGGVYTWVIYALGPVGPDGKDIGWFYAGSTSNFSRRFYSWRVSGTSKSEVEARQTAEDNGNWSFRIVTRDWSAKYHGKIPHGLTLGLVRLGAEQLSINALKKAAKAAHFIVWNSRNAISKKGKYRKTYNEIMETGAQLLENQMENNAAAGPKSVDGDQENIGSSDLPSSAWGEIEAGANALVGGC